MDDQELFDEEVQAIREEAEALADRIDTLPMPQKVEALNEARKALHAESPFRNEPVDCVLWVPQGAVEGNNYNPNEVAPPEMRLLKKSIDADGYTQPVVVWEGEEQTFEVVDGEHRSKVPHRWKYIRERMHGYLPVTEIKDEQSDRKNRMAATIRHNRARGVHGVGPMTELVAELVKRGWADEDIAEELGMEPDEVLRFKQNASLPELFEGEEYSRAWE